MSDLSAHLAQLGLPIYQASMNLCPELRFMFLDVLSGKDEQFARGVCRYETMIEGGQDKKDWSKAEKYYRQAVNVFPEGAVPFTHLVTPR